MACRAFYLFFRDEFNKFNNTRARMLDSIHHMPLKLIKNPDTTSCDKQFYLFSDK